MSWLWLCVVLVALGAAPTQAVVGGNPAAAPEPDAAVVFTQKHGFSARLEGLKDDKRGYYTFAGIRYVTFFVYRGFLRLPSVLNEIRMWRNYTVRGPWKIS